MTRWAVGLVFHGIGTPGRALPDGEARYWIDRDFFAAALDRIVALPDPTRVRISFDDGNRSDLEIGLPLLAERGLTADFFVLTGRIGLPGSLGEADIRALLAAGMGIGSHGIAHREWSALADSELREELEASRAALEALCGVPVRSAGIPFGAYSRRVLMSLRRAGYVVAFSSDGGRMDPAAFLRPRTSVRADMGLAELDSILSGRMDPRRRLRRMIGMARKRYL